MRGHQEDEQEQKVLSNRIHSVFTAIKRETDITCTLISLIVQRLRPNKKDVTLLAIDMHYLKMHYLYIFSVSMHLPNLTSIAP